MSEPQIEEFHADKDGVRIRASIPRLDHLFQECVSFLAEHGGENFITLTATNPKGQQFEITVRKSGGKTPAERIAELEAKLSALYDHLNDVHHCNCQSRIEMKEKEN